MALIYTEAIQHYFKAVVGGTAFENIADVIAFDWEADIGTYEPEYKNTPARPTYETSRKINVEYEIDYNEGADFPDFLFANEDARNLEIELVRVSTHKAVLGLCPAKKANFTLMPNPTDGAAGEPLRNTGSMTMSSAGWTYGTFDLATQTFTEES